MAPILPVLDPFVTSFLASVAHRALTGGLRRFLPGTYNQETESAVEQTVDQFDGVSRQLLIDVLRRREVQASVRDFVEDGEVLDKDFLTKQLEELIESQDPSPDIETPEAVIDELLRNLNRELERNHPEVHHILEFRYRKKQLEHNEEVVELLDDILAKVGQENSSPHGAPRVEIDETTEIDREETYVIRDFDELESSQPRESFALPVTHTFSVNNVGDGVIENCRVWLDYFHLDPNPVVFHALDEEMLHVQTQLPWVHPTSGNTVTLGPNDTVPVQMLAETKGPYAFIFPGIDGLPDLAPANLYGSRKSDTTFPSSWWFLAQRNICYIHYNYEDPQFGLIRVTGSNVDTKYATVEFGWDGWAGMNNPLPISIKEVCEPSREFPVSINIDALEDSFGHVLRTAGVQKDCSTAKESPIKVKGDPESPLPPEITFSSIIPTPDEAARLSFMFHEGEGLSFTYYEYLCALVSCRIADRSSATHFSLIDAIDHLSMGESDVQNLDLDTSAPRETDIRLTDAAIDDLQERNSKEQTRLHGTARLTSPVRVLRSAFDSPALGGS
jgi:hypothetical protein